MWLTFHRFLRALSETNQRKASRRPRTSSLRPRLEVLEDRTLLSTYLVTNTLDSGAGSLRQAILNANAANTGTAASPDLIQFNIPTSDPGYNSTTSAFSIKPLSALPTITDTLVLDGYSQPGASPNTLAQGDNAVLKIQLNLSAVVAVAGLSVSAGNTTIRGLVVNGIPDDAPAIYVGGTGDHIEGNFIGTDVTGTQIAGNAGFGIQLVGTIAVVGGTTPGARNIISGNGNSSSVPFVHQGGIWDQGSGDSVQGNYIGTDLTGTKALGNGNSSVFVAGVVVGNNATIGGTASGTGNLISGNQIGISTNGYGVIQGNLIGTDVTGTSALGNGTGIFGGVGVPFTIGGTTAAARNIISGNGIGIRNNGSTQTLIEGNYIGTDITGTKAVGNGDGVDLFGASLWGNPGNVTLGGTVPGDGNVISGNQIGVRLFGNNNVVQGNLIGTDYTGTKAVGNSFWGILAQDGGNNNLIGGLDTNAPGAPLAGGGNVISGNNGGVYIAATPGNLASGDVVEGNYIGTDITGRYAIGNDDGVFLGNGATGNTIGGTTPAARNIISGNTGQNYPGGVVIGDNSGGTGQNLPSNNLVEGNYLGTDVFGSKALGNYSGILLAGALNNTIAGNVISGNGAGILSFSNNNPKDPNSGNIIQGNLIGTDATGTTTTGSDGKSLGNSAGVELTDSFDDNNLIAGNTIAASTSSGVVFSGTGNVIQGNAIVHNGEGVALLGSNNTVGGAASGAGNVIASNSGDGVFVGSGATGVSILSNSIHDNGGLGIYLDSATNANHNQAAPSLLLGVSARGVTVINGTLHSAAYTTFTLQFFSNTAADPPGFGEGQTLLGSINVTTDANGNATFTAVLLTGVPKGQGFLSATATNMTTGDTSAFAQDLSTVLSNSTGLPYIGASPALLQRVLALLPILTSSGDLDLDAATLASIIRALLGDL